MVLHNIRGHLGQVTAPWTWDASIPRSGGLKPRAQLSSRLLSRHQSCGRVGTRVDTEGTASEPRRLCRGRVRATPHAKPTLVDPRVGRTLTIRKTRGVEASLPHPLPPAPVTRCAEQPVSPCRAASELHSGRAGLQGTCLMAARPRWCNTLARPPSITLLEVARGPWRAASSRPRGTRLSKRGEVPPRPIPFEHLVPRDRATIGPSCLDHDRVDTRELGTGSH
jgi:hypothetical protein